MKIDNANLRVNKGQSETEVFITSEDPLVNTRIVLPPDVDLESGSYSLTFTKRAEPVAKEKAK